MSTTCCPRDPVSGLQLTYVSPSGLYFNTCSGTYDTIATWTDGPTAGTYNKCVFIQCAPAGYGPAQDPIDCPCCQPGFNWVAAWSQCVDILDPKNRRDPIPCPVCPPCPVPPPDPPPCVGCTEPQGLPKSFTFDPTKKNCVDCQVKGAPTGLGTGADRFIPIQLLDPLINFIFRT